MLKKFICGILLASFMTSAWAFEDRYDHRWHRAHWGEGHWVHDRHDGRLGWWWVIGDDWHFYYHPIAQPVIVVQGSAPPPPPPQVIVQQAPPAPVVTQTVPQVNPTMYYCKATGTYYPETMSCPNGWSPIVAGSPPAP